MINTASRTAALIIDSAIARRAARQGLGAPTTRERFLAPLTGKDVLEIGPFDNPALRGERVRYFDVLDAESLRVRAAEHGRRPEGVPTIHYLSPTGDLSVVGDRFDAVLSSHAIEHQPDLIAHLNDVARLLVPGGRYYVIAPDKRYCFDYFLPLSTTKDVIDAHRAKRMVHTRAAVLAHRLETTHNSALRHWIGLHGRPSPDAAVHVDAEIQAAAADRGDYVDVHAWIFSPIRFRDVIRELVEAGEVSLNLVEVRETAFRTLEYFAVLERPQ